MKKLKSLSLFVVISIFSSLLSTSLGIETSAIKLWCSEDRNIPRLWSDLNTQRFTQSRKANIRATLDNLERYIDKKTPQCIPYQEKYRIEEIQKNTLMALKSYKDVIGYDWSEYLSNDMLTEAAQLVENALKARNKGQISVSDLLDGTYNIRLGEYIKDYVLTKMDIYQKITGQQHPNKDDFNRM